jgi:hypothetical protein
MSNPNRRQCPHCHYASDTESVCPALCCKGARMLPAPDAPLDREIFTAESWRNQCEAERELEKRRRPTSTGVGRFFDAELPEGNLDHEAAERLRGWEIG